MTSSLQRAVQTGNLEVKKGAFESSFAAGLDLSEFGGSISSTTARYTHASAAAELLSVKAREAQRAAHEEREETRIQVLAKTRGQQLQTSQSEEVMVPRHAAPHESHSATDLMENANVCATLVHMHGDDINGAHHKAKIQRKGNRSLDKAMRRKRPAPKSGKGGKTKGVVKRSRGFKY